MLTYDQTLKYLETFVNHEKTGLDTLKEEDFNLDRMKKALKEMGDPHQKYQAVHVAGTKGKGSISTFTSSILQKAGYRVGLYTSPHLDTPRERISVNGRNISEEEFAQVTGELREYLDGSKADEYSFFEVLTLMAMLHFKREKVDYAVFEVGLGGRLDATNVLSAVVCGIAPISYDHTHVLGSRIEEIAGEKAAIIKKSAHCVCAPQKPSALDVVKKRCEDEGVALSLVGEDIKLSVTSMDEEGSSFDVSGLKGEYKGCRIRMPGDFQPSNCAAAIGICEQLPGAEGIDESTVKEGLLDAFIPGRMEVISRKPLIVLDGAQNAESALRLKNSVEQIFEYDKLILLLGISRDKDIEGICKELVPLADEIVITRASLKRAADPHIIRGYVRGKWAKVTRDVKEALGCALKLAGKKDMILAAGSFYVVGEVRKLILKK